MLKILWKMGEIAPEEQFLPLSTIFYYLMLDFFVKIGIRFSLRDKRLFEITEVEITRFDCISKEQDPSMDPEQICKLVRVLAVCTNSMNTFALRTVKTLYE